MLFFADTVNPDRNTKLAAKAITACLSIEDLDLTSQLKMAGQLKPIEQKKKVVDQKETKPLKWPTTKLAGLTKKKMKVLRVLPHSSA